MSRVDDVGHPTSPAGSGLVLFRTIPPPSIQSSMPGSGIDDCIDGGGIVLKRTRPDPAGEVGWPTSSTRDMAEAGRARDENRPHIQSRDELASAGHILSRQEVEVHFCVAIAMR